MHWPVMSYSAASRYEPMAKAKNVSAVARSGRGFMRAYEKAGSWAALDQWWKDRRDNFVSRHMAQVRQRGEKLWKNGHPSRRALALIMWAYMPPGKTTKSNPLYRTGRHLLFTKELPEGRSNKVRYFLNGHEKPWQGGRGGFGPEWEEVLRKSGLQARALMAQRNPRQKTKAVRLKVGGKTIEVRLIRSNPGHADVLSYFHPDCQKEALEPPYYKSRNKVIKMSPAAFLDMAMPLFKPVESKMQNLRELVAKGVQIRDLPTLIIDRDGYVKGHEGRHRAMLLESLGFKEIPVVLSSANIRWSEQGDPSNRFDYIEKWPLWLVSEDESRSMRFPVKRSEAAKSAWNSSV